MSLISLVVTLIVVGVLLWLVNTYIPMDGKIKKIIVTMHSEELIQNENPGFRWFAAKYWDQPLKLEPRQVGSVKLTHLLSGE